MMTVLGIMEKGKLEGHVATLDEAMVLTGFGVYNILNMLLSGLILMGMIMETLGLSYVIPAAQCDLQLTLSQKGWLAAIPFIAIILTSHLWGWLADTRGRRPVMLVSMAASVVLSVISSFSANLAVFATLQFLACIFISGPAGVVYAYLGEFNSLHHRDKMVTFGAAFVGIGTVVLPAISWLILPMDLNVPMSLLGISYRPWRLLVVACAIPYAISCVLMYWAPESPKYLNATGQYDACLGVLRRMYSVNKRDSEDNYPVTALQVDSFPGSMGGMDGFRAAGATGATGAAGRAGGPGQPGQPGGNGGAGGAATVFEKADLSDRLEADDAPGLMGGLRAAVAAGASGVAGAAGGPGQPGQPGQPGGNWGAGGAATVFEKADLSDRLEADDAPGLMGGLRAAGAAGAAGVAGAAGGPGQPGQPGGNGGAGGAATVFEKADLSDRLEADDAPGLMGGLRAAGTAGVPGVAGAAGGPGQPGQPGGNGGAGGGGGLVAGLCEVLSSMREQTVPLFKPPLLLWTCLACFVQFGIFATANGFYVWFPSILNSLANHVGDETKICDVLGASRLAENGTALLCDDTVNTSTFERAIFVGLVFCSMYIIVGFIVDFVGKKTILVVILGGAGLCGITAHLVHNQQIGVALFAFFQMSGACIGLLTAVVVELFPTKLRAMAVCLSLMMGRVGSVLGSNVIGVLLETSCGASFYIFGGLLLICSALCLTLPGKQQSTKTSKLGSMDPAQYEKYGPA